MTVSTALSIEFQYDGEPANVWHFYAEADESRWEEVHEDLCRKISDGNMSFKLTTPSGFVSYYYSQGRL